MPLWQPTQTAALLLVYLPLMSGERAELGLGFSAESWSTTSTREARDAASGV